MDFDLKNSLNCDCKNIFSQIGSMKLNFNRYFLQSVSVGMSTGILWADRFADQGEKCREVSLSMTLRFSDLLPVQEVENVLPSDPEIWPIVLGFGDVFELEFG